MKLSIEQKGIPSDLDMILAHSTGPMWDRLALLPAHHRVAALDGATVVLRHDDARAVLASHAFHQGILADLERTGIDPRYIARRRKTFLTMDGADHARVGKLVGPAFRPAAINRFRQLIRATLHQLLESFESGGDIVAALTEPFPIPVICAVLGIPAAEVAVFSRATEVSTNALFDPAAIPEAMKLLGQLDELISDLIERKRTHPSDDLLCDLIHAEEDGDRLSHEELIITVGALIVAGTDTVRNQFANMIYAFARHPESWERIRDDISLIPRGVDEANRWCPAVPFVRRVAVEDCEIRGLRFAEGERVALAVSAINRDPGIFERPDSFELDRPRTSSILTYGAGVHYCLGAALARVELTEGLTSLVERFSGISLAGDPVWRPALAFQGPSQLLIEVTPA